MSDTHGNLAALRAVVDSLPDHDRVVVAGDLCLDGPDPAEVLDLLQDLGWSLLRGNTDQDLVSPPLDLKDHKARLVQWTREQLGERRLGCLDQLAPSTRIAGEGGETVLVVHANPLNLEDHLRPTMTEEELEPYLAGIDATILAFGHLHIPYVRPVAEVLLVDVASVGHPKDHDLRAAYTVLTWDGGARSITQVRVPYDVEEAVHRTRRSGMPDAEKQIALLLRASY